MGCRLVSLSLLVGLAACEPRLNLVIDQPEGVTAPLAETLHVTGEAEVEGERIELSPFDVSVAGLPYPFHVRLTFEGFPVGVSVTFHVVGLVGTVPVYSATASTVVGLDVRALVEFCGDGVLNQGELHLETCDEGEANSDTTPGACRSSCQVAFCGDQVADPGEACDDANGLEGDGCDTNCTLPACGNGIVDPGEVCFAEPADLAGLPAPAAVVAEDFDRDGDLDLLSLHTGSDRLRLFLNEGQNRFALLGDVNVGNPLAAEAGDLDGDGDLDLLVSVSQVAVEGVQVLLNTGNGQFLPLQAVSTGFEPGALVLGDLDGDGDLDGVALTVANNKGSVCLNKGGGQLACQLNVLSTGSSPSAVALGDLNQDGALDVVTANKGSNNVSVFLNQGGGNFGVPKVFFVGTQPTAVFIEELTGDGKPDVVVADSGGNTVGFLEADPTDKTGGFFSAAFFAVGLAPTSLQRADLNGDGQLDLVVANQGDSSVSVLLGDGTGQFAPLTDETGAPLAFPASPTPRALAVGDLNQDGVPDLVTAGQDLELLLTAP